MLTTDPEFTPWGLQEHLWSFPLMTALQSYHGPPHYTLSSTHCLHLPWRPALAPSCWLLAKCSPFVYFPLKPWRQVMIMRLQAPRSQKENGKKGKTKSTYRATIMPWCFLQHAREVSTEMWTVARRGRRAWPQASISYWRFCLGDKKERGSFLIEINI